MKFIDNQYWKKTREKEQKTERKREKQMDEKREKIEYIYMKELDLRLIFFVIFAEILKHFLYLDKFFHLER